MTIAILILTCTIFVALGWTGDIYSPVALLRRRRHLYCRRERRRHVAGPEDGYIVGATPLYQQIGLIIGVRHSSFVIGMTTLYLHKRDDDRLAGRCRRHRRR